MAEILPPQLAELVRKIDRFGKENLTDILHEITMAVTSVTHRNRCRIYLEDLTAGCLTCAAVSGLQSETIREITFPLTDRNFLVSRVYLTQEEGEIRDTSDLPPGTARTLADRFSLGATCQLPLVHTGHSIGVLCIDSGRPGQLPSEAERNQLRDFLDQVVPLLDQARKYHQQIKLARRINAEKDKQAATFMVRSAVDLIEKLALASVLVPLPPGTEGGGLRILASYSPDEELLKSYETDTVIDLGSGRSLLSNFINREGIITDEQLLRPIYLPDLTTHTLQKEYLTEQMGLRSLYVVPRYDRHTKRVICLVNYYTQEAYQFSDFERGLLEAHAEMAQRVIQEIGGEHMEIQVLAEINDLLQERFEGLQPFLSRILSKATDLIGADTGSIALVEEREGERWLSVERQDGKLVGAKSKEWLKRNIPPIRVGGEELPNEERSLTGLAAATGTLQLIADVESEQGNFGFYRAITPEIRSELAVPVIHDDEVLAVICLDSLLPDYFTDEHRHILQIIQRLIARRLFDLHRIEQLTTEIEQLRSDVGYKDPKISSYRLGNIIGNSPKAKQLVDFIQTVTTPVFNRISLWARSDIQEATLGLPSLLMTGETGSGKEFIFNNLFSRLNEMYRANIDPRGELPVKKTNIAAYSGELTYSELFGHKRGAFTGAHADRRGILEEAHGGVVFLDEIGDADPKTQVQLLRFLDNGGFIRLGENQTRYARVLLVAATNKDLNALIREGTFREDLYHRLSELTIEVPSLNERREDIADLATHFLGRLYSVYRRPEDRDDPPSLMREGADLLAEHHYSGNMRELRSILVRALFFRRDPNRISGEDIERALPVTSKQNGSQATEQLTRQVADEIYEHIRTGEVDFWSGVHSPFSEKKIPRQVVVELIEIARNQGGTTMPKLARLLKACNPGSDDPDETRIFFKFKNFLYKTIKIS